MQVQMRMRMQMRLAQYCYQRRLPFPRRLPPDLMGC
jgi:hypothetical protein